MLPEPGVHTTRTLEPSKFDTDVTPEKLFPAELKVVGVGVGVSSEFIVAVTSGVGATLVEALAGAEISPDPTQEAINKGSNNLYIKVQVFIKF